MEPWLIKTPAVVPTVLENYGPVGNIGATSDADLDTKAGALLL